MIRILAIFTLICLAATLSGGAASPPQPQGSPTVLFEDKDFAIVPLSDIRDPKLVNQSLSGLLVLKGGADIGESPGGVWKLSGPRGASENYYWANSTKAFRLTANIPDTQGFLVVSKSGNPLDTKLFNTDLPRSFAESVNDDMLSIAALVDRSEKWKSPSPLVLGRARAGHEDLMFKSEWISSGRQGGISPDPLVDVIARTVDRSGTVVQHCVVWYVPIAWEDDKQHWKRFEQFSSPTSKSIPVGQYKMWADHNGQDGTKTTVNPGDDRKPTKTIDLDVP